MKENEQQQTQGKLYRCVKASERLPEKKTNCIENDKPIIFANTKKAAVMYVMQSITPNIPALLQNDLNGWEWFEEYTEQFNQPTQNFGYCKSEIEFGKKCQDQCEHCFKYYAPLEKELSQLPTQVLSDGKAKESFLDVLIENHQAQIAGYYNVDKTDAEREKRNAVIQEYSDLIGIYKAKYDVQKISNIIKEAISLQKGNGFSLEDIDKCWEQGKKEGLYTASVLVGSKQGDLPIKPISKTEYIQSLTPKT